MIPVNPNNKIKCHSAEGLFPAAWSAKNNLRLSTKLRNKKVRYDEIEIVSNNQHEAETPRSPSF